MHSAGYRRPSDVPDGTVLVVGGGNTGFQIAKELSATHTVHLAVGSRQTPLPQRLLGRDLFWWLTKTGPARQDRRLARRPPRARPRHAHRLEPARARAPRRRAQAAGGRRPRGGRVSFADGSELDVDAVIWATGYRPDHSWIELPVVDEDGRVRHRRGVTDVPGLYFLGLSWQHTRGSALLGWVKDDAEFIAGRSQPAIARRRRRARRAHLPQRKESEPCTRTVTTTLPRPTSTFPTDTAGLPEATDPEVVELADGDEVELRIAPVAKRLGDATVRMLAYNGSIPGPTLRVREGSEVVVNVANEATSRRPCTGTGCGSTTATTARTRRRRRSRSAGGSRTGSSSPTRRLLVPPAHPRGLRPGDGPVRQHPRRPGRPGLLAAGPPRAAAHARRHPDRGRQDRAVQPRRDDVRGDGPVRQRDARRRRDRALRSTRERGEVVRFYLTNTANTRVFNVALRGARMKLVGGDSGRCEHEELVESVVLAPSERAVVDVLFDEPGEVTLEHRTPGADVPARHDRRRSASAAEPALDGAFDDAARQPRVGRPSATRLAPYLDAAPDKTLAFVAEMDIGRPEGAVVYACPMHPEVVSDEARPLPRVRDEADARRRRRLRRDAPEPRRATSTTA